MYLIERQQTLKLMSSLEIRSKEQNYMTKNVEHKEA
jgi:hypothetical protein